MKVSGSAILALSSCLVPSVLAYPGAVPSQLSDLTKRESSSYKEAAECVARKLVSQYDQKNGLFATLWWQSPSALGALATLYQHDPEFRKKEDDKGEIFSNTLEKAWHFHDNPDFLDDFIDDQGWWGLGFLDMYDLTKDVSYLYHAAAIATDMSNYPAPCGGLLWNKKKTAMTAIADALYIQLAAGIANRAPAKSDRDVYYKIASDGFWWFLTSNMVDDDWVVHDGLKQNTSTNTCTADGGVYSYNQGVILGAAAELYKYTKFDNYTEAATKIADSALAKDSVLLEGTDVFGEKCNRDLDCSGDARAFKAPFIRNLRKLAEVTPGKKETWSKFIQQQAQSIIKHDMNQTDNQCEVGLYWQGPIKDTGPISQWSGLEVILAASILNESDDNDGASISITL